MIRTSTPRKCAGCDEPFLAANNRVFRCCHCIIAQHERAYRARLTRNRARTAAKREVKT